MRRRFHCVNRWLVLMGLCAAGSLQAAQPRPDSRHEAALREGVALAQACDEEIDEDLHFYAECVRAKLGLKRHVPAVRAGLQFQAWLVADLLARQHADAAAAWRTRWAAAFQRDASRARVSVVELCRVKSLDCADVRRRLAQRISP